MSGVFPGEAGKDEKGGGWGMMRKKSSKPQRPAKQDGPGFSWVPLEADHGPSMLGLLWAERHAGQRWPQAARCVDGLGPMGLLVLSDQLPDRWE